MATPSSSPKAPVINVNDLAIPDLTSIQKQVDTELEFFIESVQQLKEVQQKFSISYESLNTINPKNKGKELLIPLTSSMYVPAVLSDVSSVVINIGTGYYAEMSVDKAQSYFKRKVADMNVQIEKIQGIITEKRKLKSVEDSSFGLFSTKDLVPIENLQRLKRSRELQSLLNSDRLRCIISLIVSAKDPAECVQTFMEDYEFQAFAALCLNIANPEVNLDWTTECVQRFREMDDDWMQVVWTKLMEKFCDDSD
ncbi:unnamed protein product [Soboliphyme baturini]|uniref:Prefoldin subunit n=1 Tax=Soboliphyme baturini TaxID=241478 RepID=A0A183ITN6_9BILA|nr:unnamed protein product [Soboliphyme baturini]